MRNCLNRGFPRIGWMDADFKKECAMNLRKKSPVATQWQQG